MVNTSFNKLTLHDRAMLIAEFGVYLESIEWFSSHWIHLYSIEGHFVEVYYNLLTRQIDLITMISYDGLDKYLPRIVINGLHYGKRNNF